MKFQRVHLIFLCWTTGESVRINHYIIGLDHLFSAVLHAHAGYSEGKLKHCFASLPSRWRTGPLRILKSTTPGMKESLECSPAVPIHSPPWGLTLFISVHVLPVHHYILLKTRGRIGLHQAQTIGGFHSLEPPLWKKGLLDSYHPNIPFRVANAEFFSFPIILLKTLFSSKTKEI